MITKLWKRVVSWSGWGRILFPNLLITLLLALVSGVGLIFVFANGLEYSFLAYLLYPVSAYSLLTISLLLWKAVPLLTSKTRSSPVVRWITGLGASGAFDIGFYLEQIINFCYGGFKIVSGVMLRSAWIWTDGLYNFTQGVVQLYQLLRHRKSTDLMDQWKVYRRCGSLMILVNLTMTGMVFQMIHLGRHEENTEISMIATAAFAFYKLSSAIIDLAKDRKHKRPVDSAARFLNFGQALYNLFVLQVGLLWTYGEQNFDSYYLLNTLTGFAVCILVCGIGIYMRWRANRDMKVLLEQE